MKPNSTYSAFQYAIQGQHHCDVDDVTDPSGDGERTLQHGFHRIWSLPFERYLKVFTLYTTIVKWCTYLAKSKLETRDGKHDFT